MPAFLIIPQRSEAYICRPIFELVIKVRNKYFEPYILQSDIDDKVKDISESLQRDYDGLNPVFLCVLNGAFMFFGDLMKRVTIPSEVAFIKAASYEGMKTTGDVTFQAAGKLDIQGRHVVIIEDIVDTGNTLEALTQHLSNQSPASIKVCTLLFKKEAYEKTLPIDYVCFETENKFLLGYGLDYDGYGRNLPEVYILKDSHD